MGKLALAAKITHVPSMYISELPGRHHGCREAAIAGHRLIGERGLQVARRFRGRERQYLVQGGAGHTQRHGGERR